MHGTALRQAPRRIGPQRRTPATKHLEAHIGGQFPRRIPKMQILQLQCPNCDGVILTTLVGSIYGNARDGDRFEQTCPHCSGSFPIGFVSEYKKIEEEAEVTSTQTSDEASGGGYGLDRSPSPTTSNDQRSDSMNPNNPAFQAASDNRSNQMNPNNAAYRSSRG